MFSFEGYTLDIMRCSLRVADREVALRPKSFDVLRYLVENADRVVVMYAGRKVEEASVDEIFDNPGHPYTRGLLGSIPHLDFAARGGSRRTRLNEIKGMVPSLAALPPGCSFAPRCSMASDSCRVAYPPLSQHRPDHWVACWHAEQLLAAV